MCMLTGWRLTCTLFGVVFENSPRLCVWIQADFCSFTYREFHSVLRVMFDCTWAKNATIWCLFALLLSVLWFFSFFKYIFWFCSVVMWRKYFQVYVIGVFNSNMYLFIRKFCTQWAELFLFAFWKLNLFCFLFLFYFLWQVLLIFLLSNCSMRVLMPIWFSPVPLCCAVSVVVLFLFSVFMFHFCVWMFGLVLLFWNIFHESLFWMAEFWLKLELESKYLGASLGCLFFFFFFFFSPFLPLWIELMLEWRDAC